ncbi:hypothetical protein C8Q74DRAFT_1213101 [Fomes fomentarius]|nr:hypothetical protein C8Q74DRAFT_1213101 [Fomes fomentarius]
MSKRKRDSTPGPDSDGPPKRVRTLPRGVTSEEQGSSVEPAMDANQSSTPDPSVSQADAQQQIHATSGGHNGKNPTRKVRKLVPPRPFPTVPASVSATGPRSAHVEGKNHICITRRTELGAYLRRCKDVFLKDGYKTLHLSAMGAAIPHLMQLALSLPPILPYPQEEIQTEVITGTVDVQDELIPDDEDEDISYRTRGKSTVSIVIKVGDGIDEPAVPARGGGRKNNLGRAGAPGGAVRLGSKNQAEGPKGSIQVPEQIVIREDELDDS